MSCKPRTNVCMRLKEKLLFVWSQLTREPPQVPPSDFNDFFCPQILHSLLIKTPKGFGLQLRFGWVIEFLIRLFPRSPYRCSGFWRTRTLKFEPETLRIWRSQLHWLPEKISELLNKSSPRYEVLKKCMLYTLSMTKGLYLGNSISRREFVQKIWNFVHMEVSTRLAFRKKFRTFERTFFETCNF